MTRRRAVSAIGAAALPVVLLIGWPGGASHPRTARTDSALLEADAPPAPEVRTPAPMPFAEVTPLPDGEPVPLDELLDDPNRVPGPDLEVRGFACCSGRPVGGALVRLFRAYPSGRRPEPSPVPFAETRSRDDGSFSLHGTRRSSLVVEVRHEGYAVRRLLLVMPLAAPRSCSCRSHPVSSTACCAARMAA